MPDRTLSVWHVASLLVSTSCGIGFLLGTGELALKQGMAGSLYAVATAIGLVALAFMAPWLWSTKQSIWAYFGTLYGSTVSRHLALLSLVWMIGVLSAQIRGASSILCATQASPTISIVVIDCLVFGLSFLRLSWLSGMFAICMIGCNAVLIYVLIKAHSLATWIGAPASFAKSIGLTSIDHTGVTLLSVIALVLCGADYHQFPTSARTRNAARIGCLIAAAIVFIVGFLPASTVLSIANIQHPEMLSDPVQIIPKLIVNTFEQSGKVAPLLVVLCLLITALGSACSVIRAMVEAATAFTTDRPYSPVLRRIVPIGLSTLVATHGQSMIDMMISLNIVYLASAGPLLGLTCIGHPVTDEKARQSMFTGFCIAMVFFLIQWLRLAHLPDAAPLVVAWPCALVRALHSHAGASLDRQSDVSR
jgi:solute:Na+ symporter, SSS family